MWGDKCHADGGCEHYDPLDDDHFTNSKDDFYNEWITYTKDWN